MQLQSTQTLGLQQAIDLIAAHLPLEQTTLLELGCGKAQLTHTLVETFPIKILIATEVDQIQHAINNG